MRDQSLSLHSPHPRLLVLGIILVMVTLCVPFGVAHPSISRPIVVVNVAETISPLTVVYLERALARAENEDAECIIVQLDTPGGLYTAMRDIVKLLLNSPIPVIVYVSPQGARAASAGTFIALSAHVLVMAPGTNIGAAHPVSLLGGMDETMETKVVNDSVALIRSVAEQRGNNPDWAETAVRDSASITAAEALTLGIADSVQPDRKSLIQWLNGRSVLVDGSTLTLDTVGQPVEFFEPGLKHRFFRQLADPNLAYILLMVAVWGILLEVFRPGLFVPGIAGGISLVLSLFALQLVPFTTAGILLILLAAALFFLETQITSYGFLGIGGIVALVLGSLILLEPSAVYMSISWVYIAVVGGAGVALFLFIAVFGVKAHLRRPVTGKEGIVGLIGVARTSIDPEGTVHVHGELWHAVNAIPDTPIQRGDSVKVIRLEGMRLFVQKQEDDKWDHS